MKKLVVFTGAGMSAESGISTFRDAGGLWEKHRIEDVATPEAWRANPELVHRFYNERRQQLVKAQPNLAHLGLVDLEKKFDVQIVTQNVDNLHERAGSSSVLHLHGNLMQMRSTGNGAEVYDVKPDKIKYSLDDVCPNGFRLRPHIVWFGEAVPAMAKAIQIVTSADVFVLIGTSLEVYPAAGLIHYVGSKVPMYVIDPNAPAINNTQVVFIRKGASQGVTQLLEILANY